jgi:hypothetical protein
MVEILRELWRREPREVSPQEVFNTALTEYGRLVKPS